jgi:hypothetical protein
MEQFRNVIYKVEEALDIEEDSANEFMLPSKIYKNN